MSREIKFRGLRVDGGGWVYGYYMYDVHEWKSYIIDEFSNVRVIPETVGQFTGLKDRNGKKIYEGDILVCEYWDGCEYVVEYEQDSRHIGYWFPKNDKDNIEIIGNIHEQ